MKFATAIILSTVFATGLLFAVTSIQSVDAVKSSGTKNQQFGKNAQIQVCGSHFCKSESSMTLQSNTERNTPTQNDLDALIQKMNVLHRKHLQQMSDQWRLMTNTEKAEFIDKMNLMMTKMESVDMMSHMQMMLGDQHDQAHAEMKNNVHNQDNMKSGSQMKHGSSMTPNTKPKN